MGAISLLFACISAMVISWLGTPLVFKLAEVVGAIDKPDERKIHIRPIPRLGGVAVFAAFMLALILQVVVHSSVYSSWVTDRQGLSFLAALTFVFLLGIWDDIKTLKPLEKFLVQMVLSSLLYVAGFRVSHIPNTLISEFTQVGAIDFLLTTFWIVGVTNAINLIDGLDGLASGVSTIAAMSIFAVALLNQDFATATVALVLAGSLVGFLRYNFYPAKIFLGDSGSLFVGFALAVLSLQTARQGFSDHVLVIPMLVLGLPIIDTLLAMVRRFLRSFLPKQQGSGSLITTLKSVFLPDRSHVHHRLIARGLSHMRAVLVLYLVSFVLGFGAIAIRVSSAGNRSLILLVLGIALSMGIAQLRYREMAVLRNGIMLRLYLRLYDLKIISKTAFQVIVDGAFILIAYTAAYLLTGNMAESGDIGGQFWPSLPALMVIQLGMFWISGLYKGTTRQAGVGDALRTTKSVLLAALVSALLLAFVWDVDRSAVRAISILDFYFLLTLVVCSRFSFIALKYLFEKEHGSEKRILIYGADSYGVLILQNILGFDAQNLTPIGFLDDDPQLEGKYLNGYPIFGGHWQLHRLIERLSINEILLAQNISAESLKRLKMIARAQGVTIRRFQIRLEDVTREVSRSPKDQAPVTVDLTS
jgi:UDP-GlcNAc:undecaprenyl-phosphate/decaprenyl-phosphate GlcNAc-1-phosphate transferase